MDTCPAIWNVLHDAILVGIEGAVPGNLRLKLECDYLRERFADPGNSFILRLHECSKFRFQPWSGETVLTDLNELAEYRLWILSADVAGDFCKVHCSQHRPETNGGGTLEVSATSVDLSLDSGRAVSLKEIETVADTYWTEWEAANEARRQNPNR